MHNAEPDLACAERVFGIPLHEMHCGFDTMTASMALHGPGVSHALKTLAFTDADTGGYQEELERYKAEHDITDYSDIPLDILASPYASSDGDTTAQLATKYIKQVQATGQWPFYSKVLLPSYRLNIEMHRNGLLLDWDEWHWRWEFLREAKAAIYAQVEQLPAVRDFKAAVEGNKKRFSLKSGQQLAKLLFDVLRVQPSGRLTKLKKPALDAKAVKEMLLTVAQSGNQEAFTVLQAILEAAKADKYLGTYIEGIANKLWNDGRIHAR